MSIFKGVCTALITPFNRGSVDISAFARLLEFQLKSGVDALLVCGTTGEASTMTENEKISIIRLALEYTGGRVPVIVGVGGNNTAQVIDFVNKIQYMGISGLLCVTPYYNKTTQNGLIQHYNAIAKATALPIIAYNVPSRTGVNIQPETLEALVHTENIVAIKEASGNAAQAVEMLSLCGDKLDLYSGNDDITVPLLSVGGIGVISVLSNIMPADTVAMVHTYLEGDVHSAAKMQKKLMPIIKCLFSEVNPIPVKTAASLMGLCTDEIRLPLTAISSANKALLTEQMQKLGLI